MTHEEAVEFLAQISRESCRECGHHLSRHRDNGRGCDVETLDSPCLCMLSPETGRKRA